MARSWFRFAIVLSIAAFAAGCSDSSVSQVSGPSGPKCQTALTGVPESFPSSGTRLSATVTTTRECQWTVTSEAAWIQVDPSSGQGGTGLTITVAQNPVATRRSSTILVNDNRVTVRQS